MTSNERRGLSYSVPTLKIDAETITTYTPRLNINNLHNLTEQVHLWYILQFHMK